jgi:hypothetical protein
LNSKGLKDKLFWKFGFAIAWSVMINDPSPASLSYKNKELLVFQC